MIVRGVLPESSDSETGVDAVCDVGKCVLRFLRAAQCDGQAGLSPAESIRRHAAWRYDGLNEGVKKGAFCALS